MNKNQIIRIILNADQVLFIPQGFYHRVSSFGDEILGINIWFNSIYNTINNENEDYLLKYCLNNSFLNFK